MTVPYNPNFLNMQQNYFPNLGLQNAGQFLPYQLPLPNYVQYPDIVGDGEVTSIVLPNGSLQYIFIPSFKRDSWAPHPYSPNVNNINWNFNKEAWIIRNFSNPIPSYCLSQQSPRAYGDLQISSTLPHDYGPNTLAIGYHNKFHYDQCTSTTDLHYFYPSLRKQPDKCSASVQIDTPVGNTVCHCKVVCGRPCYCTAVANGTEQNAVSKTGTSHERICRCMSVDNVQDPKVKCECSSRRATSDKMLSTCNNQASGPPKQVKSSSTNRQNQTDQSDGTKRRKSKSIKLRGKRSPIKIIGVCEGSCCCSSSYTTEGEF